MTKRNQADKRRYLSSAERKEEILDAALAEFSDKTYNAVSMERIASRAGLSKAGIYAHFKSKEEIFHALLERAEKMLNAMPAWFPEENLPLTELVDIYLERLYTTLSSPMTISIYRLLLSESARVPELIQNWHIQLSHKLQERAQLIMQQNIQRGAIRKSVLTDNFFPLALSPALLWLHSSILSSDSSPTMSLEQIKNAHRQLLLELLQPK